MASAEPSVSVPGDSVPIPPDTYALVVTDDLRVRSKPGVSDDSKKLEPLLQQPVRLVVLDGPVQASGYDWYLVQPNPLRHGQNDVPVRLDRGRRTRTASRGSNHVPRDARRADRRWTTSARSPRRRRCTTRSPASAGTRSRSRLGSARPKSAAMSSRRGESIQCGSTPAKGRRISSRSKRRPTAGGWSPTWSPGIDTSMAGQYGDPPEDWPIVEVTGTFDHPAAQTCRNRLNYEAPSSPSPIRLPRSSVVARSSS